MEVVIGSKQSHCVVGNHRAKEIHLALGESSQGFEERIFVATNHRLDAGRNTGHILRLEAIEKLGILALLLEVVDQGLGVALDLSVDKANMNVFLQKVVR